MCVIPHAFSFRSRVVLTLCQRFMSILRINIAASPALCWAVDASDVCLEFASRGRLYRLRLIVHISLLGFGVVRLLIRISLSRVFALPKKSGAIQPQSDVGHSRGDHVVGRQLLMRFRCSVSIAPVLSGIMLGGSWDSAPPFVALISAR